MTPATQRALVIVLIGLGVLIVGFFGLRTIHAFGEFRGHRPPRPPFEKGQPVRDAELIRDWMTIPAIGKMYHIPPPVLFDALQIPQSENNKKSLKELNDEYFPNQSGHVLEVVKATVQANLPPTPIPAATAIMPATAAPPATAISPVSP
jgi:hypothetical protein